MKHSFLAQCGGKGGGGSSVQATHTLILDTALLLEQVAWMFEATKNLDMDAKFLEKRTSGNMVLDVWKYLSCYDTLLF